MATHQPHNRRTTRIKEFDYSLNWAYFVTVVTYQRLNLFGIIVDGKVELNTFGCVAFDQWRLLGHRFPQSDFSKFVVMPNHIHGLILPIHTGRNVNQPIGVNITPHNKISNTLPQLGVVMRAYKASVTFRINAIRGLGKPPIWQRNYYEQIIRNARELENVWNYIDINPDKWEEDRLLLKDNAR